MRKSVVMNFFAKRKSAVHFASAGEEFKYWYELSKKTNVTTVQDLLFSSRITSESASELVTVILRSYERDLSLLDANISDTCIDLQGLLEERDFDFFKVIESAGIADVDNADAFNLVLFFAFGQSIRDLGYGELNRRQWTRAHDRAVIGNLLPILRRWGFEATGGFGLQMEFQRTPPWLRTGSFGDFVRERRK